MLGGAGWSYLATMSSRFVSFAGMLVLARLLQPAEFGLMAMAWLIISYCDTISDIGVGPALVQRKDDLDRSQPVALTVSIAGGVIFSVCTFLSAPFIGDFFGRPELSNLVRILSPYFLFSTFISVQSFSLQREFRFNRRVAPELLKSFTKAGTAITMAALGYGVWSLVWGQMLGQVVGAAAYVVIGGVAVKFAFDRKIARELVAYGAQYSFATLIGVFSGTIDQLMIGRLLGPEQLGIYNLGWVIPELVIMGICNTASQVAFPAFSRVQDKPRLLRASFLISLKLVLSVTIPAAVGIALIAPDLIRVFYSEVWDKSVPVLQVMAITALLRSLTFNSGDVLKAIGEVRLLSILSALGTAVTIPVLFLTYRHGIVGVALAILAVYGCLTVIMAELVARKTGLRHLSILRAMMPVLVSACAMAVACSMLIAYLGAAPAGVRLAATVIGGALVYGICLWRLDPGGVPARIIRNWLMARFARNVGP